LLLVAFVTGFGTAASQAQTTLTAYFDFSCPSGSCAPGDNNPIVTVPSEGQITFTVVENGTISATLEDYTPARISGFGFDPCLCVLPESLFAPGTPDNALGWGDNFGTHDSGFASYNSFDVPSTEFWMIGNPGEFSSVGQVLNGGDASFNFFLDDDNGQFGALAEPVPEGGSGYLYLLLAGGGLTMAFGSRIVAARKTP
jgi:hypothetical protein